MRSFDHRKTSGGKASNKNARSTISTRCIITSLLLLLSFLTLFIHTRRDVNLDAKALLRGANSKPKSHIVTNKKADGVLGYEQKFDAAGSNLTNRSVLAKRAEMGGKNKTNPTQRPLRMSELYREESETRLAVSHLLVGKISMDCENGTSTNASKAASLPFRDVDKPFEKKMKRFSSVEDRIINAATKIATESANRTRTRGNRTRTRGYRTFRIASNDSMHKSLERNSTSGFTAQKISNQSAAELLVDLNVTHRHDIMGVTEMVSESNSTKKAFLETRDTNSSDVTDLKQNTSILMEIVRNTEIDDDQYNTVDLTEVEENNDTASNSSSVTSYHAHNTADNASSSTTPPLLKNLNESQFAAVEGIRDRFQPSMHNQIASEKRGMKVIKSETTEPTPSNDGSQVALNATYPLSQHQPVGNRSDAESLLHPLLLPPPLLLSPPLMAALSEPELDAKVKTETETETEGLASVVSEPPPLLLSPPLMAALSEPELDAKVKVKAETETEGLAADGLEAVLDSVVSAPLSGSLVLSDLSLKSVELESEVVVADAGDPSISISHTGACANGVDPFFRQQVDTFVPPDEASQAAKMKWKTSVDKLLSDISRKNYGGEKLRLSITREVSLLSALRLELFCDYV